MSICQSAGLVESSWTSRLSSDKVPPPPSNSPDLTPCNFFLWGHIKDLVHVSPLLRDTDELKEHILEVAASVNSGHAWTSVARYGLQNWCLPHEKKGAYIKNLYITTQTFTVPLLNKIYVTVLSHSHSKIYFSETVYSFTEDNAQFYIILETQIELLYFECNQILGQKLKV